MKLTKTAVSFASGFGVVALGGGIAAAVALGGNSTPAPVKQAPAVVRQAAVATDTGAPVTAPASAPVGSSTQAPPTTGAPVTNPAPSNPPAQSDPVTHDPANPPVQNLGTGTVDEGGVRRAPAPVNRAQHPTPPAQQVPGQPTSSTPAP